jgi:outer membrane immunogenic protein
MDRWGTLVKALKIALLGGIFAFGASAANAADLYKGGSLKDAPDYLPPITWTGFYIGGHIGGAFDDNNKCEDKRSEPEYSEAEKVAVDTVYVPPKKECEDGDDTIFLGGVHAGYNWQKDGPLVLGIEGDVSFGDDIEYLASIRGRLGFAFDNLLIYGTGGVAFLGLDDEFGDDDSLTGWVAGLGADYKLSSNVSVGLEGLYYSFDSDDSDSGDDDDFWVVRGRLSYHLDAGYEALK